MFWKKKKPSNGKKEWVVDEVHPYGYASGYKIHADFDTEEQARRATWELNRDTIPEGPQYAFRRRTDKPEAACFVYPVERVY